MMHRRSFLGWLAGALVVGCGSDTETGGLSATSTSEGQSAHTHVFTITDAELASPPAAGISRGDSGSGHTHIVTLTQAQIQAINEGTAVTVTASNSAGHSHSYTFQK